MKILVKFPTRTRPDKFNEYLCRCIETQSTDDVRYFITLDEDDPTLKEYEQILKDVAEHNVEGMVSISGSKIKAVNRDMEYSGEWDILVLMSDDMWCMQNGWDRIIQDEMNQYFPDTDGVLFHPDGRKDTAKHNFGKGLNTMCILGRKYYERFNYIYHPDYKSLCCDDEFTDVGDILKRQQRIPIMLFQHRHYSAGFCKADALMMKTESFYKEDLATYRRRKAKNFDLR